MTALWLVLISRPAEGRRLSWPGGGKTLKDEPRSPKAVSGGKFLVGGEGEGVTAKTELGGWLHTQVVCEPEDSHPS